MLSLVAVFFNFRNQKNFQAQCHIKRCMLPHRYCQHFLSILGYSHMACIGRASTVSLAQQFLIYLHIPLPYSSVFLMIPQDVFQCHKHPTHPIHILLQPTNIYRQCTHQSRIFEARSFLIVSTSFFSFSCLSLNISSIVISWSSSARVSLIPGLPLLLLTICFGLGTFLAQVKA